MCAILQLRFIHYLLFYLFTFLSLRFSLLKVKEKMILDFTISNYRSIHTPQTISFEATNDKNLESYYVVTKGKYRILKLATILGANASGKSNVIKAFRMLYTLFLEPCRDKSSEIHYDKFALNTEAMPEDSEMIVNVISEFSIGRQNFL